MTAFAERIDRALSAIEASLDDLADTVDVDCERNGNVLTLSFENGRRIVVNGQEASTELWVAARSGAFHYRWDDAKAAWIDTRSGDDVRVVLSRLVADETGISATIRV